MKKPASKQKEKEKKKSKKNKFDEHYQEFAEGLNDDDDDKGDEEQDAAPARGRPRKKEQKEKKARKTKETRRKDHFFMFLQYEFPPEQCKFQYQFLFVLCKMFTSLSLPFTYRTVAARFPRVESTSLLMATMMRATHLVYNLLCFACLYSFDCISCISVKLVNLACCFSFQAVILPWMMAAMTLPSTRMATTAMTSVLLAMETLIFLRVALTALIQSLLLSIQLESVWPSTWARQGFFLA